MSATAQDEATPLNPQRRLRHLTSVVARNLSPLDQQGDPRLLHSYFTLSASTDSLPFYTSETVFNSNNPTWRDFDLSQLKDTLDLGSSKLVIQLWGAHYDHKNPAPEGAFVLLVQWNVDLYGLEFYRAKLDDISVPMALPPDSILVRLASGFYCASPSRDSAQTTDDAEGQGDLFLRRVDRNRVRPTYNRASLMRILTLQRAIQQVRTNTEVISDQTSQCIKARDNERDLQSAAEKMRMVVATFAEEERLQKKDIESRRAILNSGRAAYEERQTIIKQSHATLAVSLDELRDMKAKLRERRQLLWQAQSMVTVRQTRIILELSQIFPLRQGPPPAHNWSICRLELPNNGEYSGCDEETVATALGYVSHLTFMIAKYLEVPFRYPMRPMCSRSTIVDEISPAVGNEDRVYPLYAHGKNKGRFENAVTMLNTNIEQLLAHCGLRPIAEGAMLASLHMLLRHFLTLNHSHANANQSQQTTASLPPDHPPGVHANSLSMNSTTGMT